MAEFHAHLDEGVQPPGESDTEIGDFAAAFAAAPVTIDDVWRTPLQNHCQMEPCATTAWWDGDKLTVNTSVQMVRFAQNSLAETLMMPAKSVRLLTRYIGGGFGGKGSFYEDLVLASLASRELKQPVKIAFSRQQMMHGTVHRPATVQHVRLGATPDGKLTAMSIMTVTHCDSRGNFTEHASNFARSLYAAPNRLTGPPPGADGPAGGQRHARAGRGLGHAGPRSRHGRTGRKARHGPDGAADPQRAGNRSGNRQAVLDPPAGALHARGRAGLRLGPAHAHDRGRQRRPLDDRPGHGRGDPRQHAAAGQVQLHGGRRRGDHRQAGHDRHRHRHLHGVGPDRGGDAGRAAGRRARRDRRQRAAAGARFRRPVRGCDGRLGGARRRHEPAARRSPRSRSPTRSRRSTAGRRRTSPSRTASSPSPTAPSGWPS